MKLRGEVGILLLLEVVVALHAGQLLLDHRRRLDARLIRGNLPTQIDVGALQLALDRGEQVGWFESNEIIAYAIISVVGVYYFLAHSLTTPEPFIRFDLFKDRNFASAIIMVFCLSGVMQATAVQRPDSLALAPHEARESGTLELLVGLDAAGSPGPHLAGLAAGMRVRDELSAALLRQPDFPRLRSSK